MLLVREILGQASEPRFAGRDAERLVVDSADASKRRLRGNTDAGTDVAIDLERGAYLADGVVLHDDGIRIVVVERKAEEAMVVRFAAELDPNEVMRQAVRIGHAFGNQHVPLEVDGDEIHVPITTSREIVHETVRALHVHDVKIVFRLVKLGRDSPLHAPAHKHP